MTGVFLLYFKLPILNTVPMLHKSLLTGFHLLVCLLSFGQAPIQKMLDKAFAMFDEKQYDSAFKYFDDLRKQVTRTDSLFPPVAFGYTASLYFRELDVKNAEDWNKTEELAYQFLAAVEEYKGLISDELSEKRYFAWKDIVVANFGLQRREKAREYQLKLYDAYKNKQLPQGINEYYNFHKFTWQGLNVWAYEWFPDLGDKETEGSFSKHVYYFYSTDIYGNDKDQLFRLHTIKVHKRPGDNMPDFVLTFRQQNKDGETSRSLWDYTFKHPVDYGKLDKAVLDFLEKNEAMILTLQGEEMTR